MGEMPIEIKTEKLQAQIRFATNTNLQKNALQVEFNCASCNPQLKGNIIVLVSTAG